MIFLSTNIIGSLLVGGGESEIWRATGLSEFPYFILFD